MHQPVEFSPEPLPHAPLRAGEFIAHRAWMVLGVDQPRDRIWLNSFVMRCAWMPRVPLSDTSYNPERRIQDHNEVGVWGFKNRDDLFADFLVGWDQIEYPIAIGTAWLWGTVIEHNKGYRAQYAAVRSVDEIRWGWCGADRSDEILAKLRDLYVRSQ